MKRVVLAALFIPMLARATPSATLAEVRGHGRLTCGVVTEAADWNKEDLHGNLSALGVEICRAVAVATLGHEDAVVVTRYPAEAEALGGLEASKVDLLVGVTPSITAALQYNVTFGPAVFWDAQTFMVHRALGVAEAAGLAGKTVCYIDGTDNGGVLLMAMAARRIGIIPFPFQEEGEMDAGLIGGHCRAISAYASKLAEVRTQFHALVHDFVLLPEMLAVSPINIVTRQGDAVWSTIAAATVQTLVQAEMAGIARADAASRRRTDDPVVQHLLGANWSAGLAMGLAHDWSAAVIGRIGNYGEIFDRSIGLHAPLGLSRGLNATCLQGGMLCAEQVR